MLLPDYCARLLKQVNERTGYPLEIIEENVVRHFDFKRGSKSAGRHVLSYSRDVQRYMDHMIAWASYQVLGIWALPKEKRWRVMVNLDRGLPQKEYAELLANMEAEPSNPIARRLSQWFHLGLTHQLITAAADLRLEKQIWDTLPEHRGKQASYLTEYCHQIAIHNLPRLIPVMPEKTKRTAYIFDITYQREISNILNAKPANAFIETEYQETVDRLLDILHRTTEPSCIGDRIVIDTWAKELGMRDWYYWKLMEE